MRSGASVIFSSSAAGSLFVAEQARRVGIIPTEFERVDVELDNRTSNGWKVQPPVTWLPVRLPMKKTRSASRTASFAVGLELPPTTPTASGWSSAITPFAWSDVATGIDKRSAKATSASDA